MRGVFTPRAESECENSSIYTYPGSIYATKGAFDKAYTTGHTR